MFQGIDDNQLCLGARKRYELMFGGDDEHGEYGEYVFDIEYIEDGEIVEDCDSVNACSQEEAESLIEDEWLKKGIELTHIELYKFNEYMPDDNEDF